MVFSLVTEPWLPCYSRHGRMTELGLRELITTAHDRESLHDESPLATLALHRLVLALLHRVYGPVDRAAWVTLYRKGRFEAALLDRYLERWVERFDLLHPERPFYQARGLWDLGYEPDGLGRLILERSNYGAAVNVFQHRPQWRNEADTISLAEAARTLVTLQAFAPGGLVKKAGEPGSASAAPLNRGAAMLVRGSSLFDTLMFNLLVYEPGSGLPVAASEADAPCWEQASLERPVGTKEPARRARGWLDLLTWQSRRLELWLDERNNRRVRGVVYCVGQGLLDDDLPAPEPMLAYSKRGSPAALRAVDINVERALWRDSHALIRHADADQARAAKTVLQLAHREIREAIQGKSLRLSVLGMKGDQAKIEFACEELLPVPFAVLHDPGKVWAIRDATQLAEDVGQALRFGVRNAVNAMLSTATRDADKDDVTRVARSLGAEGAYWWRLGYAFESFLDQLVRGVEDALAQFAKEARFAATQAFHRATTALGQLARQLQGAARAGQRLAVQLEEIISQVEGAT